MSIDNVITLVQHTHQDDLPALIRQHIWTLDTIQALKAESARFYFTAPARALEIARVAQQVSLHLPPPAPALGGWTLANALIFSYQYAEAAHHFAQAYTAYQTAGYSLEAARLSVGYTIALAFIGQTTLALALAAQIEPLLAAAGQQDAADQRRLGNLLMNVGLIHELLGEYEEALAVYERQATIARQLDDPFMLAQLKHNQACALVQMNVFDEAARAFQEAETLFRQEAEEAIPDLVRVYTNHTLMLLTTGHYAEASQTQTQAEELLKPLAGGELQRHWLAVIRGLVDLETEPTIDQTTLDALLAAQAAFTTQGPDPVAGLAWIVAGRCYLRRQEWDAATSAFITAQQMAAPRADRTLAYRALHGLGQVAAAQAQPLVAIDFYLAAIQQIESIRQSIQVETFRADFLTDKLLVYQDLASTQLEVGELAQLFATIERAKARVLAEKLSARLTIEAAQLATSSDASVRTATQQLTTTLQRLDELYRQARLESLQNASDSFSTLDRATNQTIGDLEETVQSLTRQIQRQQPLFSAIATGTTITLPTLQAQLGAEFFLQYQIIHNEVGVLLIQAAGSPQYYRLAALAQVEAARTRWTLAVERALELASRFGRERAVRYLPALLADANQHLHTLFQLLLAPLTPILAEGRPLLIAPDGPLHYIPFHALYDGQRYVVEQQRVSYVPSATVLALALQTPAPTSGMTLLGYDDDRLAAVSEEITALQQLFPDAQTLLGEQATTEQFFATAATARILHLAAHARFRQDNPMLSAISLADRRLTLAEIAQLSLPADLVVLSACETGRGQARGVDLLSLAGGFLGAGARSLLVSLWRAEDAATKHLMTHFYQALLAGQSRAAALRTAQLALLKQGRHGEPAQILYQHPAFWAPFILMGNGGPLPNLRRQG